MKISFYTNEEDNDTFTKSIGFLYLCSFNCPISNSHISICKDIQNDKNKIYWLTTGKHTIIDHISSHIHNSNLSENETKDFIQSIYNNQTLVKTLTKQQLLKEL